MLTQMKSLTTGKLQDDRRSKQQLMSSSSLSGMSQLSNSSEEALEPFVHHKPNGADKTDSKAKDRSSQTNEWLLSGPSNSKSPMLRFKCSALAEPPEDPPAKQLHMTYKIFMTDTKLVNLLLQSHGLTEVSINEPTFNILWIGNHPKPDVLRNLLPYQKVNHFPRSYEITRKDRLYKNIEAMQRSKGTRNLDFIPQTFVLPNEARELVTAHFRYRGPWIVKPKASSCGRGIYIVNSPEKILTDESVIVAQYINNPLLVDGHKCDLRLYVAVTNYDPLVIYLYEEGLVRFATVKYDGGNQYVWNPCMHLCNYSINKFHVDYVKSEDPDAEDVGHKWTLSALLRHLRSIGQDTELLMQRIEDVIIKSILATASGIISGIKQFVKHPDTCFELFGFDILIDDTLKPWLIEVNFMPSLGCDSPLDVRVKSALIADLLTLVGVPAVDPILRPKTTQPNRLINPAKRMSSCRRVHSAETLNQKKKPATAKPGNTKSSLSSEQQRILASARAQFERRGGFVLIFPSPKSWELYSQYLDPVTGIPIVSDPLGPARVQQATSTNHNLMLHEQLFPAASRAAGYIVPDVKLDRLSRFERYERALVKGHKQSLDRNDSKENLDNTDTHKYKSQVMQMMHEGNKLSSGEARKAFGHYLSHVLRKISQQNPDFVCCDLVSKFLQQSANNLRTPFMFTLPNSKLGDKDRAAVTAKQLSDFLYLYNRETDLYADSVDRPKTVPNRLFQKFLLSGGEEDLDDVLILQTKLYNCAHTFLGRSSFAGSLRGTNLLGSLPHITSRVHINATVAEQCKCNQSSERSNRLARA
ncbi:tubulin polyglutamylase TTLL5 [Copidosoma floridanum]|uniref:tubulin polyglutamylase TTLL5 n=1 Tax=Copidosoma floridanum TaxID=29053 RepID=UPI0006C9DDB2|nr:tubulin polyglutamylase TTLL5 [Copidosoma floridanum]